MSEKKNFWGRIIGSMNAMTSMGRLSPKGDVTSSWSVTALDGEHFISMDEDGMREGWTTIHSPGQYNNVCGKNLTSDDDGYFVEAEHGNIILKAEDGFLKIISAKNIEINATSSAEGEGNITLKASNNIVLDAGANITVKAPTIKLNAEGFLGLKGGQMKIIADLIEGVSAATGGYKGNKLED